MIAFTAPNFLELSAHQAIVKIPLAYRTKNHLGSMYFGALAVGADLVVGGLAWHLIQSSGQLLDMIFKDFQAEYLKRAEGDVIFVCEEGEAISEMIADVVAAKERRNRSISAYALVPERCGDEKVASFRLTLSLKLREC